jgi:hypothetical protein
MSSLFASQGGGERERGEIGFVVVVDLVNKNVLSPAIFLRGWVVPYCPSLWKRDRKRETEKKKKKIKED